MLRSSGILITSRFHLSQCSSPSAPRHTKSRGPGCLTVTPQQALSTTWTTFGQTLTPCPLPSDRESIPFPSSILPNWTSTQVCFECKTTECPLAWIPAIENQKVSIPHRLYGYGFYKLWTAKRDNFRYQTSLNKNNSRTIILKLFYAFPQIFFKYISSYISLKYLVGKTFATHLF